MSRSLSRSPLYRSSHRDRNGGGGRSRSRSPRGGAEERRTCHRCGKTGHFARECPMNDAPSLGYSRSDRYSGRHRRDSSRSSSPGRSRSVSRDRDRRDDRRDDRRGDRRDDRRDERRDNRRDDRRDDRRSDRRGGSRDREGDTVEEFSVDNGMAKHIVGRGGSKVRNLEGASGAKIDVSSNEDRSGRVLVSITGSKRACQRARDMIEDIVAADGHGGYDGERNAGGGDRRGGRDSLDCYKCGREGHYARNCPDSDRDRDRDRDRDSDHDRRSRR